MLRTDAALPVFEQEPVPVAGDGVADIIDFAWVFLRRQYPIILFCALLGVSAGAIYLLGTPPRYTAHTNLIVDARRGQFLQQQSILADAPIDTSWIDSQVKIVKSENVAEVVIKDLHLTDLPEFVGGGTDGFERFLGLLGASRPPPKSKFELMRQALSVFERGLRVERAGASYVLDIIFTSTDADRAAQIANSVADAYIVDQMDAKLQANRRASDWLQNRVTGLRDQASAAELAVVAFNQENGIVSAHGKLIDEQRITGLNSQLVLARGRTSEAQARLNRIETIIRSDTPAASDTLTSDALNNPTITKLREEYLDAVNREAAWSARYGRNHLAVVNLRNRINEIRSSIFGELKRYAQIFTSDFEIAKQRQESLEKDLALAVSQSEKTNKVRVALRELESSAQSSRALHDTFLQRHMESIQQQSFPITEARVISPAARPLEKSAPKTELILALACMGGIGLGVALGFVREVMDRVFRTTEQVETALNAPCVALVPLVDRATRNSNHEGATVGAEQKSIARDGDVYWTVSKEPLSRFAEAIRSVKLAADLNETNGGHKVIGLTSALPHEGKSTIAAALAQLVAQVGRRCIIVDCDLRNPSMSRSLTPNANVGIVEVLAGKHSLDDAIWSDGLAGAAFLPALSQSRVFHTSEILASEPTQKLFGHLRERYDYVIADLPPLAPLIDVRATPHLIDGYFLVIEWGRTKIDVVQHALNAAPTVYERLFGTILNKANMEYIGRYEVHRSKYYLNKLFARYGYTE
jgi:succinoglycan biosynthesis transport protein ExoP